MSDIKIQNSLTGKIDDKLSFTKLFPYVAELEDGEWEVYETETFQGGQIVGEGKTQEEAIADFKEILSSRYQKWIQEEKDGTIDPIVQEYILNYLKEYIAFNE